MYRGTTPTFIFQFDDTIDLTSLTQVWVTISDGSGQKTTWDISDVTIDNENHEILLSLTQEETLALALGNALVQIRFLTNSDVALTTACSTLTIQDVLKEGVIE